MPTFTDTDIIRLFEEHLDDSEQLRVRDYFRRLDPLEERLTWAEYASVARANYIWETQNLATFVNFMLQTLSENLNLIRDAIEFANLEELRGFLKDARDFTRELEDETGIVGEFFDILNKADPVLSALEQIGLKIPVISALRKLAGIDDLLGSAYRATTPIYVLVELAETTEDVAREWAWFMYWYDRGSTQIAAPSGTANPNYPPSWW